MLITLQWKDRHLRMYVKKKLYLMEGKKNKIRHKIRYREGEIGFGEIVDIDRSKIHYIKVKKANQIELKIK